MSNNIKRYTTEEYVNEKITENRTHYIENHFTKYDYFTYSDERTAELDPVEGWFTDWSFWCCLVDENPLDYDNIIGSKVLVRDTIQHHPETGEQYSEQKEIIITENDIIDNRDNNIIVVKSDFFDKSYERVLIIYDDTVYRGINLTKGIWIVYSQILKDTESITYSSTSTRRDVHGAIEFYALSKEYHPIDEKFIPNTKVYPYFIMSSSTEGSTKKFKITIDDSGNFISTEIVE